ncbi:class F sortase [Streptomyces flaveus]|uniref:class F sortase n=1 Tax=Streptomyces flaveus TaxID=66370 RepID=UPI00332E50E8
MVCAAALMILAAVLYGGRESSSGTSQSSLHPPSAQQAPPVEPQAEKDSPRAEKAGKELPRSQPTRLLIPKISVDAPFMPLALDPKGQLEAPPADNVNLVGWYAEGASPGEAGTSIIAGHVDTRTSPAVFAGLGELKKGDVFHVVRADGRKASFAVDSAETFKKDDFPDERVYADTSRPEVRLITCAGAYDRSARDYTENLVVFAHLV